MAGSILGWMSFSAFARGQEAEEFADNRYLRRLFSLFGCFIRNPVHSLQVTARKSGWCPKMYAASNKSVVDIEKSDGKCLNVIEHLLGKTAGFTHRTAYPLA